MKCRINTSSCRSWRSRYHRLSLALDSFSTFPRLPSLSTEVGTNLPWLCSQYRYFKRKQKSVGTSPIFIGPFLILKPCKAFVPTFTPTSLILMINDRKASPNEAPGIDIAWCIAWALALVLVYLVPTNLFPSPFHGTFCETHVKMPYCIADKISCANYGASFPRHLFWRASLSFPEEALVEAVDVPVDEKVTTYPYKGKGKGRAWLFLTLTYLLYYNILYFILLYFIIGYRPRVTNPPTKGSGNRAYEDSRYR